MKHLLAKASLFATFISVGASAIETNTFELAADVKPKLSGLKLAVIKDAIGSDEIVAGNYTTGLNKITDLQDKPLAAYDTAMGACVANIKLNDFSQASSACSKAIDAISAIKGRSRHNQYLKSIAYSNRAIVRYLSDDNQGALEDFTSALLVDDNSIVKNNILALKQINVSAEEKIVEPAVIAD
jgi:hypothetical protein